MSTKELLTTSRLLNDKQILELCKTKQMITPFETGKVREKDGIKRISYGLSSFGYDCSLSDKDGDFKIFHSNYISENSLIDPKNFNDKLLTNTYIKNDSTGKFYVMPPHSYALGVTKERFNIPNNVFALCVCKSTYARCGLSINTTPIENNWKGDLVIELANLTSLFIKVYVNEGIAQIYFFESEEDGTPYTGHYQDQKGLTLAKV